MSRCVTLRTMRGSACVGSAVAPVLALGRACLGVIPLALMGGSDYVVLAPAVAASDGRISASLCAARNSTEAALALAAR